MKQHTLLLDHHHVEPHLAAPDAIRARAGVDDRCERRLFALGRIARISVARGVLLARRAATMARPAVRDGAHTVGVTYLRQGGSVRVRARVRASVWVGHGWVGMSEDGPSRKRPWRQASRPGGAISGARARAEQPTRASRRECECSAEAAARLHGAPRGSPCRRRTQR